MLLLKEVKREKETDTVSGTRDVWFLTITPRRRLHLLPIVRCHWSQRAVMRAQVSFGNQSYHSKLPKFHNEKEIIEFEDVYVQKQSQFP